MPTQFQPFFCQQVNLFAAKAEGKKTPFCINANLHDWVPDPEPSTFWYGVTYDL